MITIPEVLKSGGEFDITIAEDGGAAKIVASFDKEGGGHFEVEAPMERPEHLYPMWHIEEPYSSMCSAALASLANVVLIG